MNKPCCDHYAELNLDCPKHPKEFNISGSNLDLVHLERCIEFTLKQRQPSFDGVEDRIWELLEKIREVRGRQL